jgi:hypothetical protein
MIMPEKSEADRKIRESEIELARLQRTRDKLDIVADIEKSRFKSTLNTASVMSKTVNEALQNLGVEMDRAFRNFSDELKGEDKNGNIPG